MSKPNARLSLVLAAILSAAICTAQSADGWATVTANQNPATGARVNQKLGAQVPLDTPFKDQTGQDITVGNAVNSRPALLVPIFYRCTSVCNTELQGLVSALPKMAKRPGRDFNVVVLSIDPQEGPSLAEGKFQSMMKALPTLKGTEQGWHFLTGSLDNIRKVTDAVGFQFRYDAAADKINHPSGLIFLTPSGKVSSYVLNPYFKAPLLTQDLGVAIDNTVGLKSEDIFFGCIHCDPITGKKSIVITRFLSIAAAVTVIGLIALVGGLFYKARDKSYST